MNTLIFGDSITQGYLDEGCGGWANRLHTHTIKKRIESNYEYDYPVFNLGISGDCTSRLLERFDTEAKARARGGNNTFIFAIGVNDTQRYVASGDIKTPADKFAKNLETLIHKSKEYTEEIAFVGIAPVIETMLQPMPWASDRAHYVEDIQHYDQMLRDACGEHGCIYIGMEGIFGEKPEQYLPDGIHPDTEGHRLMYEHIKEALEKEGIL